MNLLINPGFPSNICFVLYSSKKIEEDERERDTKKTFYNSSPPLDAGKADRVKRKAMVRVQGIRRSGFLFRPQISCMSLNKSPNICEPDFYKHFNT